MYKHSCKSIFKSSNMKKLFYFAAAAVALAACAKNEVIPVNSGENQEITFNVAPKTKANPDEHGHNEFGKGNEFASWAYYLGPNKTWKDNSADAKEYISGATISYNTTEKVWKADKSYYWPKDGGTLTFFAYSLNKNDLEFTSNSEGHKQSYVTCSSTSGISAHIDLSLDKNVDFLVADPAENKKSNVDEGKHFVDGVPTLFRHKLSYIIFNVKTDKDYYTDAGKTLTLKSIKFNNVSYIGGYRDFPSKGTEGQVLIKAGFTPDATKRGVMNYTGGSTESPFSQKITSTNKGISPIDNFLYIPQTFADNAEIEVVYAVTTTVGSGSGSVTEQDVKKTIQLNTLFKTVTDQNDTEFPGGWRMGKKYTINLTFTLDEILWDPAVQEWEDVNIGTDAKPIIVG